jgi:hypothetical protein
MAEVENRFVCGVIAYACIPVVRALHVKPSTRHACSEPYPVCARA